jgi:hypothetical protein
VQRDESEEVTASCSSQAVFQPLVWPLVCVAAGLECPALRPAHGAGARRLCGAACLLSAPRLATPGGAPRACGQKRGGDPRAKEMPPAGDRPAPGWRGRRSRPQVRSGVRRELPSRPPPTQAEPSRCGPLRPGRSYSGALHLDAMDHARSTVCGSAVVGMEAGIGGGLRRAGWSGPEPPQSALRARATLRGPECGRT